MGLSAIVYAERLIISRWSQVRSVRSELMRALFCVLQCPKCRRITQSSWQEWNKLFWRWCEDTDRWVATLLSVQQFGCSVNIMHVFPPLENYFNLFLYIYIYIYPIWKRFLLNRNIYVYKYAFETFKSKLCAEITVL